MIQVNGRETSTARALNNTHFKAKFSDKGQFIKLENLDSHFFQVFEESYSYFNSGRGATRSGFYLFNPRRRREDMEFKDVKMHYFELPGMASMIQVEMVHGQTKILKTHIVYQDGDVNLQKQLYTQIQVSSGDILELSYGLKKVHKSSDSTFRAYADDSMKLVERPIYDKSIKIKRTNDYELNGYFTSSCVHGGIIRETYDSESFFGWANSNPIGCNFPGEGQVNIMIFRSVNNNDWKGISETLNERHVLSTDFQLFVDNSVNKITNLKLAGNAKLNEPLSKFMHKINLSDIDNMHYSDSLLEYTINSLGHETQLSNNFGEVDVVDAKIMKHNMIKKHQSYEIDIVLRNRFDNYVKIDKASAKNEGIFKNHFIDTFKNTKSKDSGYKINPDQKILPGDRYDLKVLETEVSTKIWVM